MPIRNIGLFAHVDAGKTTLSEQLLLACGAIREAGSVDRGTAHTDDLPVERRRGISVRAACVRLRWKDTDICLIDTPGHTDFAAEIERSFWALDAAVLLVDSVQGVQPQTEALFRALKDQGMPVLFFLNKTDRDGSDPDRAIRQISRRLTREVCPLWDDAAAAEYVCGTDDRLTERYLNGDVPSPEEIRTALARLARSARSYPALRGSALRGQGVRELLDAVVDYLPGPADAGGLCGVAFSAARDKVMGRGLWVRLFGGRLENRMAVTVPAGTDGVTGESRSVQRKISQIRSASGEDLGALTAGEVGVVYGLGDLPIGHVFGDPALLPRKVKPGSFKTPLIMARAVPDSPDDLKALREACMLLSSEDPLLEARYVESTGEILLQVMGKVQLEILQETLETRFSLKARFGEPAVIYRETVRSRAAGFVAYTMPKPCWAVLEFDIAPGRRGSGVRYASTVPGKDILPRYQHQVEQALPLALSQGRLGWQVTDVEITLVGGNHHLIHTHPLDFIVATPMAIQDGLRRAGSVLLEPILSVTFVVPAECSGRVISDVQLMRGEVTDTFADEESVTLTALVPVSESIDYPSVLSSVTHGKGAMSASLHGYRECPQELGKTAPRRGVDPLDTAKYILAARSALEGGIFDA